MQEKNSHTKHNEIEKADRCRVGLGLVVKVDPRPSLPWTTGLQRRLGMIKT